MNTQAVVDLTQSLGWIINQEKSELKPTQVFSSVGYEYHLDSALVKPTQERWLKLQDLCPPPWGVDILFLLFAPSDVRCPMSDVRRPMSGVTHGFRSFKGKVLELLSPNLVCRLIGSVACLGLLLAVVPLLLTE